VTHQQSTISYAPGEAADAGGLYRKYARLREQAPVYRIPGRNDFFVSRYDDVVYITEHPEIFSNQRNWKILEDPELRAIYAQMPVPIRGSLADNDPPEHRVFHEMAVTAFRPGKLREKTDDIRAIVDGLIDRFVERGEVEFVSEFANQLPSRVIATLLGLPVDRHSDYTRWFDSVIRLSSGYLDKAEAIQCAHATVEYYTFLAGEVDRRIDEPNGDVISGWVHGQTADGQRLDRTDVANLIRQMLGAGQETSAMANALMMRQLIEHPEEMERVRDEPAYVKLVIEETLRLEQPIQWQWRYTLQDTELRGVTIPKGARILLSWASANRDEEKWEEPERFHPERPHLKSHMGFGKGLHYCIGAPLARLEMTLAFERLLARMEDIEIADSGLSYPPSPMFRALARLPLRFTPVAA
jgi:cytochrome P450